jgi:hypothetical protein
MKFSVALIPVSASAFSSYFQEKEPVVFANEFSIDTIPGALDPIGRFYPCSSSE